MSVARSLRNRVPQAVTHLAYIGAVPGSVDRNAWYTPAEVLERVRAALGPIDFDPWSDPIGNAVVQAREYRSADGPWPDGIETVFGNPPYGRGLIQDAVTDWITHWTERAFTAGILLTNNATETGWWQALARWADVVTFPNHRISFLSADGKAVSGNTRGQTLFYFGPDPQRFHRAFSRAWCWTLVPIGPSLTP